MASHILTDFEILRPRYEFPQGELLSWLGACHAREAPEKFETFTRLFQRFGCDPSRIAFRGTILPDTKFIPGEQDEEMKVYGEAGDGAGIGHRTELFAAEARQVLEKFYPPTSKAPGHLVHVTCTGYISPSPAQSLVDERSWSDVTDITHAYHMGCYASVPAVRMAQGFLALTGEAVDIVHTEMCTLHMEPRNHSPEQMVVQSLFGDGNVKYSLRNQSDTGLEILATKEWIIPGTQNQMSWMTTDTCLKMTLAREVPATIAGHLKVFLERLHERAGLVFRPESTTFAVHPGGPKIIDTVLDLMRLREDQVAHSRAVLFDYGNMSSATLPHIWERIIRDPALPSGQLVASLAFGPGLTIFGLLARKK